MGQAVHEALATLCRDKTPDLPAIARKYDVELVELSTLYGFGGKAWLEIQEAFPGEVVVEEHREVDLGDDIILTGHTDLVTSGPVIDWKSGRIRYDAKWQMEGYGRLWGRRSAFAVWLRFMDTDEFELMSSADFDEAVKEQVKLIGKVYSPGHACVFCPRKHVCDARKAHMQDTLAIVRGKETAEITREDFAKAYPMVLSLEKACEAFRDLVKANVRENGPLAMEDGLNELAIVQQGKTAIDPIMAWPIISKHLDENAIAGVVTLGKGKLEKALMSKAEKGEKRKFADEVLGDLFDAGAIHKVKYDVLKKRKKETTDAE
jgi:hypothetical protein